MRPRSFAPLALACLLAAAPAQAKPVSSLEGIRGTFFDMVADPYEHVGHEEQAARFQADGLLVVDHGHIKDFGSYASLKAKYPGLHVTSYPNRLITPGFIDGHIHFPQTRALGAYGEHLLEWLQESVFPEERKYADPAYAKAAAKKFFDIMLANGTTTVQSFLTTSPVCCEAFFDEAARRDMRVIGGITGIDTHAPAYFTDTPAQFDHDSRAMYKKYHRKGRALYAITPRFAYGCSHEMMQVAGKLHKDLPDAWINTHLAETPAETKGVLEMFPEAKDYLGVYEEFGLVGPKFSGGHSVYLSDSEMQRVSASGAALIFCPCSNLFLGSGLFRLGQATNPQAYDRIAMGTDMGGGNCFSMFRVLDEAYKVGMLNNNVLGADPAQAERNKLSPYRGLFLSTLGGARALRLDDKLGNFEVGKEADFVVLDPDGPPQMAWHQSLPGGPGSPRNLKDCAAKFFGLMAVGDDRNVSATYVAGKLAFTRKPSAY